MPWNPVATQLYLETPLARTTCWGNVDALMTSLMSPFHVTSLHWYWQGGLQSAVQVTGPNNAPSWSVTVPLNAGIISTFSGPSTLYLLKIISKVDMPSTFTPSTFTAMLIYTYSFSISAISKWLLTYVIHTNSHSFPIVLSFRIYFQMNPNY